MRSFSDTNNLFESFAFRLKQARLASGFSQAALAEILGMNGAAISKYEKGATLPSSETLYALCKALRISSDVLLGLSLENETINPQEREVLGLYSQLSERDKFIVLGYMKGLLEHY